MAMPTPTCLLKISTVGNGNWESSEIKYLLERII